MLKLFFTGLSSGCLITFVLQWFWRSLKSESLFSPCDDTADLFKMALVVNKELKMGDGKMVAQCSHAAVGAYESFYKTHRSNFDKWEKRGKPISVFKVEDTLTLKTFSKTADNRGLISYLVTDAGLTQIASGSKTVLAIGPETESVLNSLTEFLQPYS